MENNVLFQIEFEDDGEAKEAEREIWGTYFGVVIVQLKREVWMLLIISLSLNYGYINIDVK